MNSKSRYGHSSWVCGCVEHCGKVEFFEEKEPGLCPCGCKVCKPKTYKTNFKNMIFMEDSARKKYDEAYTKI